jgi:hypothetical protein
MNLTFMQAGLTSLRNPYAKVVLSSALLLSILTAAHCQSTNDGFLLIGSGWRYGADERFNLPDDQIQEAVKSGECRPAEQDPQGNWGETTGGFRLSIRLHSSTNVFAVGESISTVVTMRNVTTNILSTYYVTRGMETVFTFEDETGRKITLSSPMGTNPGVSGYGFSDIPEKHQVRFEYELKDWIAYKPGVYRIRAEQRGFQHIGNKVSNLTNIMSGDLTIRIIP